MNALAVVAVDLPGRGVVEEFEEMSRLPNRGVPPVQQAIDPFGATG